MTKKVAAVTGGGRGIGIGISTCLAKVGFDLADWRARATFLAAIKTHFGRLDVLVNNAGMAPTVRADILEAGEESFVEIINVNLRAPYFLTQKIANWMIDQKKGGPTYQPCAWPNSASPFTKCVPALLKQT